MARPTLARRILSFSRDHQTLLYCAAGICLLVVAAGLRFYDLPDHYLWRDEAVASRNANGALSEVIPNTRSLNSSPILYPLALWAVQQVDVSVFSIRLLPATASVLTVAVMLFLLPRVGVNRWAAFLAALLATLSVAAIEHAQDAREYSLDTLLAALLLAGLLGYLRDGRKVLLGVALFVAPLLQYGLVLFGVAVIGAAILLTPPTFPASEGNSYLSRVRDWLKARLALVGPAGCFMAGCALSYAVTLRDQWRGGYFGPEGYLAEYYYQGNLDAYSIFEFSIGGIWSLLTYHLPAVVAIAALVALALLLVATLFSKFQGKFPDQAIAVLLALCLAIAVAVGLLSIYPLGGIRQIIYLGPLVFLAVGLAFQGAAGGLASLMRRGWLAPALAAAVVVAIALAGVGALVQDGPYRTRDNTQAVFAFLEERVRADDLVYAGKEAVPSLRFYQEKAERPADYYSYYGAHWCDTSGELCLRDLADLLVLSLPDVPNRIFLVHWRGAIESTEGLALLGEQVSVERFLADGTLNIYLITYDNESMARAARSTYAAAASGKPAIRSDFDVYLSENNLTYVKEPCAPADTEAKFFLAVYPVDLNDLPEPRQQHGFDNRDFGFNRQGMIFDGKCMATVALPKYAINRISTGQFVPVEGGYKHFWEGEFSVNGVE